MHNNNNANRRFLPLLTSLAALGLSPLAGAEIMLYDKEQTTFSTDGYINAFYVNSDVDRAGEQYDRRQSRVKMGFLPNYLGFILLDELLAGYGQVSDTLGLVDGGGVSFGNIGSGYPYPFPTSQITYRTPVMEGLRIAVGIMDPVDTNDDSAVGKAYQENPRTESEITYQFDLGGAQIYSWLNGTSLPWARC